MKRLLLLFGLLVSFLGFSQSQNDTDLTTQINSTIRGKVFLPKSHADMFKTIVDSKLNLNLTSNKTLNTGGFTFVINNGSGNIASFGSAFSQIQNSSGTTFMTIGAGLTLNSAASQAFVISQNSVNKIGVFASGAPFINVGSDATGDMLYRNSGLSLSRLAKGTEGTLLRAGASVPAYSGFTIPNTIAALSIFAANSSNVLTAITPAAGQSIRVNAGGTAWEAYTPGGGGFTNGAANNRLIKSNGTNGVESNVEVVSASGSLILGAGFSNGDSRVIQAGGGTANNLVLISNGAAPVQVATNSGSIHTEFNNPTATTLTEFTGYTGTFAASFSTYRIKSKAGITNNWGTHLELRSGDGGAGTNTRAGNVILVAGSGTDATNGNGDVRAQTAYGSDVSISGLLEPDNETGTTFTLTEAHRAKGVYTSNGSDVTVTVPADLATGYQLTMLQEGAGTITLSAGANVNLTGKLSTTGPNDIIVVWLYKKDGGTSYYQCIGGAAPTVDMVTLVGGGSQNVTLTSQAASEQFLINSNRNIFLVDLTGRDSIMFSGRVITGGHTTAVLRLEYFTSFSTTVTDYLPIGSSSTAVEISMATSNTLPDSGWIPITSGAKGLRYLAIIQEGGNGTASPVVASLTMLLK